MIKDIYLLIGIAHLPIDQLIIYLLTDLGHLPIDLGYLPIDIWYLPIDL
jgi:hypothetical protein